MQLHGEWVTFWSFHVKSNCITNRFLSLSHCWSSQLAVLIALSKVYCDCICWVYLCFKDNGSRGRYANLSHNVRLIIFFHINSPVAIVTWSLPQQLSVTVVQITSRRSMHHLSVHMLILLQTSKEFFIVKKDKYILLWNCLSYCEVVISSQCFPILYWLTIHFYNANLHFNLSSIKGSRYGL
jgi:hypothetical protein